jgi:hypothetical protein
VGKSDRLDDMIDSMINHVIDTYTIFDFKKVLRTRLFYAFITAFIRPFCIATLPELVRAIGGEMEGIRLRTGDASTRAPDSLATDKRIEQAITKIETIVRQEAWSKELQEE